MGAQSSLINLANRSFFYIMTFCVSVLRLNKNLSTMGNPHLGIMLTMTRGIMMTMMIMIKMGITMTMMLMMLMTMMMMITMMMMMMTLMMLMTIGLTQSKLYIVNAGS